MENQHLLVAQKWLAYLRFGAEFPDVCINFLYREAHRMDFSFDDIGTSEEEFEELRIKGYKIAAQKWLNSLRNGTTFADSYLSCLRTIIQRSGLSLADIGTSEEELASFAKVPVRS